MKISASLDKAPLSVFEPIVEQLKTGNHSRTIPLHQGKTWFTAPVDLRPWAENELSSPPHHDGPVAGAPELLEAVGEKITRRLKRPVETSRLQITAGITHALAVAFRSIVSPGDEVMVLSPQWLFTNGIILSAGGIPVEAPFFPLLGAGRLDIEGLLGPYLSPRTVAVYFNSPNNPTGVSLSRQALSELHDFTRRRNLWLIADNAYEDYDYSTDGFIDAASLEGADENVFAAYSFSKAFGLTGYRVGYLLSPQPVAETCRKNGLYSIYSVPTVCQYIALCVLREEQRYIVDNRRHIASAFAMVTENLRVPHLAAQGGFYLFLDLSSRTRGADEFIDRCLSRGVSLAPGSVFGRNYERFARLCFSVVELDRLRVGVDIINEVYGELR